MLSHPPPDRARRPRSARSLLFTSALGLLGALGGCGDRPPPAGPSPTPSAAAGTPVVCEDVDADGDGVSACPAAGPADCDDTRADVAPGAPEVCDGVDNGCDGQVDEGFDADGDTWPACPTPGPLHDCDDTDPSTHPAAPETCDGQDEDCDGEADNGLGPFWYPDADGDGFGDDASPACEAVSGHVTARGDCDDTRPSVFPGAPDLDGDTLDADCGGSPDPDPHLGLGQTSHPTLAQALAAAPPGGTIWVGPGWYPVEDVGVYRTSVRVRSTHGAAETSLYAEGGPLFVFDHAEVRLDGFLIMGGDGLTAAAGAPIGVSGGALVIRDCHLEGHRGSTAGALSITGGARVHLVDTTLRGNRASAGAGAVAADASTLILSTCTVEENRGARGGAVWSGGGALALRGGLYRANEAVDGGAVDASGWFYAADARFEANRADASGGALRLVAATPAAGSPGPGLHRCRLDHNQALTGGGLFLQGSAAPVSLVDVTLEANLSDGDGGGAWVYGAPLDVRRALLHTNVAGGRGGGLYVAASQAPLYLHQSMLLDNVAEAGGGLFLAAGAPTPGGGGDVVAYNRPDNVHREAGDATSPPPLPYSAFYGRGGAGLVGYGPLDPTQVEAPPAFVRFVDNLRPGDDDLLLAPGSPLRDAGDPAQADADGSRADIGLHGGPGADRAGYTDGDRDGLYDAWEAAHGLDPTRPDAEADPDGDTLSNRAELAAGTHPTQADADGDGAPDPAELGAGTQPWSRFEHPGAAEAPVVRVPEDLPDLGAALAHLTDVGVVSLAPGTWAQPLLVAGRTLTVYGRGAPEDVVIDGEGVRPASVVHGVATLEGLTLTGGRAREGGGLRVSGTRGAATLRAVHLTFNAAEGLGGGILARDGHIDAEDVVCWGNTAARGGGLAVVAEGAFDGHGVWLEDNHADTDGGGLYQTAGAPIVGLVAEGNQAERGGGAFLGGVALDDAQLTANAATQGGGLFLEQAHTRGVWLVGNEAERGGGVWLTDGASFVNGVVMGNHATQHGGGIYVRADGQDGYEPNVGAALSRVWIAGNVSDDLGGGLYSDVDGGDYHHLAIVGNLGRAGGGAYLITGVQRLGHGVVVANKATGGPGGGLYCDRAEVEVGATILASNGGGLTSQNVKVSGGEVRLTASVLFGGEGGGAEGAVLDATTLGDPILLSVPKVGAWEGADLHLGAGSPGIDAGGAGEADRDGSAPDVGIYGGPEGAQWDVDQDGQPAWFWTGAWQQAPPGFEAVLWDQDDLGG